MQLDRNESLSQTHVKISHFDVFNDTSNANECIKHALSTGGFSEFYLFYFVLCADAGNIRKVLT